MDLRTTGRVFGWFFIGSFFTSIPARLLFVDGLDTSLTDASFTPGAASDTSLQLGSILDWLARPRPGEEEAGAGVFAIHAFGFFAAMPELAVVLVRPTSMLLVTSMTAFLGGAILFNVFNRELSPRRDVSFSSSSVDLALHGSLPGALTYFSKAEAA